MEINEQAIIKECQRGNLEQFSVLYDFYFKKIYSFVFYRVKDKETAEDLVSHIFFKALGNIQTFSERRGSFSAWLYRIARNAVIDHYRTQKIDGSLSDALHIPDEKDSADTLAMREQIAAAEKYLASLSQSQQDIIRMRLWDELSYKEIAQITGKSEAACKMLFMRTIGKMRQEIAFAIVLISLLLK